MVYALQAKWNITVLVNDRYEQLTHLQRIRYFIHHIVRS